MSKKTAWFSVFRKVVPSDYENWLEDLAKKGWNIDKIGQFSSFKMDFHLTEPKQYRYVFDLNAFPKQDYIATYEQFGWEYVGKMSSCFVWRKEYTDKRPESFSDLDSLVKRNKRVRNAVTACLVFLLVGILACIIGIVVKAVIGDIERLIELVVTLIFVALCSGYLGWVVNKINRNIDR